ncbi:hypothetical protein [Clostridium sp. KNHs205]|jgi:chromosome segregation ATPase|uniref:hypothetical protein n=1 Tax=Clostridium sp. KNHs205 TaxID=1449050 RepID=UPI00068AEF85|nr:hypothetical protein [Clostridium sp. KNHs205]
MWCNQIFSLIKDEVVQNIVVCDNFEIANQLARFHYGDDAIAIDTTHFPISIGSMYVDGKFYKEDRETLVERNPTADEEVAIAKARVEELESQVATLNIAFAEVLGV